MRLILFIFSFFFLAEITHSQENKIKNIPAHANFSEKLQLWDGFGINYVEAAQTRDYHSNRQDYGGFSLLNEKQKQEILQLIFSKEGLNVEIIKMFLDPWHQKSPESEYDHNTTTSNMLYFVENGLKVAETDNKDLSVITTLYGPPPWATMQKHIGGRDPDTTQFENLARYMIHWAEYLKEKEIPVKYLSIHNEGEDFYRWTYDEGKQRLEKFDYNMYWMPEEVNYFIKILAGQLEKQGIPDLKVTNGEPSNWKRFYEWGYATSLYEDNEALNVLGLLTTHGFINGNFQKLSYSTATSRVCDLLRSKKPDLHAWVTSYSWGEMDTKFISMAYENIYNAKVNALIPWAGVQRPTQWIGGDPNPGTAIRIREDSTYEVTQGYYFYKQLTSAGHKGMAVAQTLFSNPVSNLIAFSSNGTEHPDAFVLTSYIYIWKLPFEINITGSDYTRFEAYRTTEDGTEHFKYIGEFEVENGKIIYDPPYGSTTTFIGSAKQ